MSRVITRFGRGQWSGQWGCSGDTAPGLGSWGRRVAVECVVPVGCSVVTSGQLDGRVPGGGPDRDSSLRLLSKPHQC